MVRLSFEGANPAVQVRGAEETGGQASFFCGADPAAWHTAIPVHASVVYQDLYPGIDLRVYTRNGAFEYDIIAKAHAALDSFIVHYGGVKAGCIDAEGALVLETDHLTVRQPAPATWQVTASGEHDPLQAHYRLLPGNRYGILVEGRDPTFPIVIDPGLVWSTFFGGNSAGPFPDGFLARFSPDASELLYATYLGGSDKEWEGFIGYEGGLALTPDRETYAVGTTMSGDFPTTAGAFDTTYNGLGDGFIARFDMLPSGVLKYGSASPSCQGPIAIGVLKKPQANALLFTSTNAPPLGRGFLVVGTSAAVAGIPLLGASLHVSPFDPFAALPLQANELGYAELQLSVPALSGGARSFVQLLWFGTPSCGGAGTLAASSGLAIELPP